MSYENAAWIELKTGFCSFRTIVIWASCSTVHSHKYTSTRQTLSVTVVIRLANRPGYPTTLSSRLCTASYLLTSAQIDHLHTTHHTTSNLSHEMSSQQVSKQESSGGVTNTASDAVKTTQETVSSAAANLGGAFSGSFGASAGAHSSKKTTTTTSSGSQQMSKEEAGKLYEENLDTEMQKREGGA